MLTILMRVTALRLLPLNDNRISGWTGEDYRNQNGVNLVSQFNATTFATLLLAH